MGDRQDNGKVVLPEEWQAVAVTALLLAMPSIWPGPMGWTQGFIPIPISYYLVKHGTERANRLLTSAVLIGGIAAALVGSLPAFAFSCTMVPVGIIIGNSLRSETLPTITGLRATGLLLLLWVAFWSTYGTLTQTHPYQEMLAGMDKSLSSAGELYQSDTSLSLTDKENIQNTIQILRDFLREIAPALLAITAIATVWFNMLMGQWLINRSLPLRATWPPFSEWRLPEPLIWVVIISGIATILPVAETNTIGLNVLLASGALYFFQGIAVLAKLFAKWSVPRPMQAFLFAIAILQGAGFVVLAALGVADIWVNFGAPRSDKDPAVD
ncbi:MAG: YybS family protein [Desulfobulbaceae bacterium]|nr:YybS family protein [Desulfobulbaceae bacterium]